MPPTPTRLGSRLRALPPYVRWPLAGLAALFLVVFLAGVWLWFSTDLPPAGGIGQSAVVLDRNGDELAILSQDGTRVAVELGELPDHVPAALVAAEDRRFYEHGGVDPIGITRALWKNLTGDHLQGGSTITQQLVKNVYLNSDRTISRKVREAILAVKVERSFDKQQILQRYLNTVYFGRGAYGIEAAARAYFDRHASELDPAQAAMLMGMLRAPESFDPVNRTREVKARRDEVLDVMVDMGTLDPAAAKSSKQEKIQVVQGPQTTSLTAGVAPHFIEQIRAEVIDRFGEQALYSGGLVIHTTLDLADQQAAEQAVAAHLKNPDDPQAAVVGIDRSGAVRAWVGGRDFSKLQLDLVSDDSGTGRQPGSTFKPVVLTTNLAQGHGAGVRYPAPRTISLDVGGPEPWVVNNAGGESFGSLTLEEATIHSVNTVYAQALLKVGPQAVVDMAHALGVTTELQAEPSIALGTEEITPLELATVYSTLSRDGRRIEPYRITKVENGDGDVLYEHDDSEGDQVIPANVADTVSSVLSEVPRRGTATRAALDRPMAAKTGTTQRNADAWLAGYTPEYTAIVWVGNAEGNQPMDIVDGQRVFGGSIPAEIWHDFMAEALQDVPPTDFPDPDPNLLANTDPTTTLPPPTTEATTTSSSTSSTSSSSTSSTSTTSSTTTTEPSSSTTTSTTTTTAPTTTTTSASAGTKSTSTTAAP